MGLLRITYIVIGRIFGFVKPADTNPTPGTVQTYEHEDFRVGQLVLISSGCPNKKIAGMVLAVTYGTWHPFDAETGNKQKQLVPILAPGAKNVYVKPQYVQLFDITTAGTVPTLSNYAHGYGCSCWSCTSQLVS